MVVKERRTKILLALHLFPNTPLDERLQKVFDLVLNQKTKGTLAGMLREELIEKNKTSEVEEVDNIYKLTDKGFSELCLQFPFFRFVKETWDGKWRVISYEIPEKKREMRDRLRREMQGWGLGPWHRSFWLTPHPILRALKALTSQKEEERYIQSFEADHVFGDREILIEKVWEKSLFEKKYRELFKKWHDVLSTQEDKIVKLTKVTSDYVLILKEDPGLPKELVGGKWIGFEAREIFEEIKSILLS